MNGGTLLNILRRIFVRNFYLKLIAAVLTVALYVWVAEDRETLDEFYAPIQITAPEGMVLVSEPESWVEVTLRGRRSDFNRLDDELDPIRINLEPADDDSYVRITSAMVGVPPNLRVTDIDPSALYIELEPEDFKNVEVQPRISGQPSPSYTVEQVSTSPETVTIRGPESRLEEIESVPTEEIDIEGASDTVQQSVDLQIDDEFVIAELEDDITVEIEIETEEITETLSSLDVDGVNTSYETTVDPDSADITITGPMPILDDLDHDLVRVEVDLSEHDNRPPGTFSLGADVVNLPDAVELDRIRPNRFRVTTESIPDPDPFPEDDDPDGEDRSEADGDETL